MFYIYILFSNTSNKYYIGFTSDIHRRLEEHNNPSRFDKYSAKHLPWGLVLSFPVSSERGQAMIIERFIKRQKNRLFIESMIMQKENPTFFVTLVYNILNKKPVRAIPSTRD